MLTLEKDILSLNPCFCGIYSQRHDKTCHPERKRNVLILVFVEFTLRVRGIDWGVHNTDVLILVFVEFTLRVGQRSANGKKIPSLNPCFCGIYSQREKFYLMHETGGS